MSLWVRIGLAVAACLILNLCSGVGLASDAPEYLAAERPAPESLAESPTTAGALLQPDGGTVEELQLSYLQQSLIDFRGLLPEEFILTPEGTFFFAPRVYFRKVDDGIDSQTTESAWGGSLGYFSDWLGDPERFATRLGFTGYLSTSFRDQAQGDSLGLLREGGEGYVILGEAYLEAQKGKWGASLGRKLVEMPFINANDSRMTPNSHEIVSLFYRGDQLTIGGGHVFRIRPRTESDYVSMSEAAGAPGTERGVSVVAMRWSPDERFDIGLVEQYGWDTYNTVYVEANRLWQLGEERELRTALQFVDQRSVGDALIGDFESQFAGAKVSLGHGAFIASLAVTKTTAGSGIQNPWGGSPSYNSLMISNFDRPGEASVRLGLSWNGKGTTLDRWSGFLNYAEGFGAEDPNPDQREFNFTLDYRVAEGRLGGLWLRGRAGWNWRDNGVHRSDIRVILNYGFEF